MRCDMRPPRGGYQPPTTPGGGYRLRRAPECLRGRVASGQRSTDSIGAPRRRATRGPPAPTPPIRPGDRSPKGSRRRRRRPPPGPEQVRTSPGEPRPTVAKATPVWSPGARAITRPTEGGPAAWRLCGDPAHGSLRSGRRPSPRVLGSGRRGASTPGGKIPREQTDHPVSSAGESPRVEKAHAASLKRTGPPYSSPEGSQHGGLIRWNPPRRASRTAQRRVVHGGSTAAFPWATARLRPPAPLTEESCTEGPTR